MTTPALKTVRNDMKTLVKDAQELFHEAAAATGEKADELRAKGMNLLDAAILMLITISSWFIKTGCSIPLLGCLGMKMAQQTLSKTHSSLHIAT